MIVDLQAQSAGQCYQWMTQAVVPRPIAWILTENDGGDYNLAPFSYFNALCSAPPLIGVSLSCKPDDSPKDTLRNIRARGKFVAHVAAAAQLPMLNESSAGLDYGDSELSRLGLKTAPFGDLARIEDCPVALLCRLHREIALDKEEKQTLVLGEISLLYAADETISTDEKNRPWINAEKMDPLARLSAGRYARLHPPVTLARPR